MTIKWFVPEHQNLVHNAHVLLHPTVHINSSNCPTQWMYWSCLSTNTSRLNAVNIWKAISHHLSVWLKDLHREILSGRTVSVKEDMNSFGQLHKNMQDKDRWQQKWKKTDEWYSPLNMIITAITICHNNVSSTDLYMRVAPSSLTASGHWLICDTFGFQSNSLSSSITDMSYGNVPFAWHASQHTANSG